MIKVWEVLGTTLKFNRRKAGCGYILDMGLPKYFFGNDADKVHENVAMVLAACGVKRREVQRCEATNQLDFYSGTSSKPFLSLIPSESDGRIEPTFKLVPVLMRAQLAHMAKLYEAEAKRDFISSDGFEYLHHAVEIADRLMSVENCWEDPMWRQHFDDMLNSVNSEWSLSIYSSDSICDAIIAINPLSLTRGESQ
jgi:hypothetical protein